MCQQDFLDIGVLKQCVVNRKPINESVPFIEARKLIFYQSLFDLSLATLTQKYDAPILLNAGKLTSLQQLKLLMGYGYARAVHTHTHITDAS
ncbi:hypothetical protein E2C01_065625 [Portunus trituberculatus]|uniref:Uncharacterized protein n=1 Tax=Portunus trituberculatus TaxID=210409 RepID=A0A5B7HRM2_PORTR|nr:hypothetical protein [Portunus trituberculatus]